MDSANLENLILLKISRFMVITNNQYNYVAVMTITVPGLPASAILYIASFLYSYIITIHKLKCSKLATWVLS